MDWYRFVVWSQGLTFIVVAITVVVLLAGCSTTGVQGTVNGTVADPSISIGRSTTGTWNPLPQGGTDEKSNRTPSEPAK